ISWLNRPPQEVNIDLPYLEATHFTLNYDPSISLSDAAIANEYAKWINKPNQFYDGARSRNGTWQTAMARPAAAKRSPHTGRAVTWTYTGDWRMRQMALGLANLASASPANLRESDPTKNLSPH